MLFAQALLNKSDTPLDGASLSYASVLELPQERKVRATLGLTTHDATSAAYKTTLLALLRCARAIAHKCDSDTTATLANLRNSTLHKDPPVLPAGVQLTQGKLNWIQVPGCLILPFVRDILLLRDGADNTQFSITATNTDTAQHTTYVGKRINEVTSINTPQGVVAFRGALESHNSTLPVSPCYTYPYESLASSLRNSAAAQLVVRTANTSGIDTDSDVEFLGLVAVGLAARGILHNNKYRE